MMALQVMFADPDFADFSHEIGLASLGASDEDIKRLATVRMDARVHPTSTLIAFRWLTRHAACPCALLACHHARCLQCYWFSVEFGLAMQNGERKAYGAGLLSSFGELEYSCAPYRPAGGEAAFPEYRPWEPAKAAVQAYPITRYQPVYFVAASLADAKTRMREYCETIKRVRSDSGGGDDDSGGGAADRDAHAR